MKKIDEYSTSIVKSWLEDLGWPEVVVVRHADWARITDYLPPQCIRWPTSEVVYCGCVIKAEPAPGRPKRLDLTDRELWR